MKPWRRLVTLIFSSFLISCGGYEIHSSLLNSIGDPSQREADACDSCQDIPDDPLSFDISEISIADQVTVGATAQSSFSVKASSAALNVSIRVGLYAQDEASASQKIVDRLFTGENFSADAQNSYSWGIEVPQGTRAGTYWYRIDVYDSELTTVFAFASQMVSLVEPELQPEPEPQPEPVPQPEPQPEPELKFTLAQINLPAQIQAGNIIQSSFRVTASYRASGINIQVGLYSSSGQVVSQKVFSNQEFATGQGRTYNQNFQLPQSISAGSYTYGIDVYDANFSMRYVSSSRQIAVVVPAPAPPPPPAENPGPSPADILWSADHSTGDLSQWSLNSGGGVFNSAGGTAQASTDVAHSGTHSAKLTISNVKGDQGTRLFRWRESQSNKELYYSVYLYFPQRYSRPNWWNVFQFKSKTATNNDPFFLLEVGNRPNGNMYIYMYDWQERKSYQQSAVDIPVGKWVHIEVFYRSSGTTDGQIIVWQDGVEILKASGVRTRYPDGDTQWSVNNYSDAISPDPAYIYADDAMISRTRVGPR
jgi:hypothetical protein